MARSAPQSTKCPKCGRVLLQQGNLQVGDVMVPVYQCGECIVEVDFLGEKTEAALTFALDAQGRAFDPADPERELRF